MLPYFYIGGVKFNTFPLIIFFAIMVCAIFYTKSIKYNKFYYASVFRICLPIFAFAAAGARIVSAVTLSVNANGHFLHNLVYGGSVFYGGILGGLAGLLVTCKIKQLVFLDYSDVYATILPLGHAIARIGCFFNGCCYGKQYDGFLSVSYPVNGVMVRVFPIWFIESAFCLLLFLYFDLLCLKRTSGFKTSVYLITYSVYRFTAEFMRGDEIRGVFNGLSTSQYISIIFLIIGIMVLLVSGHNNMPNYMFNKEK